jgi:hypothetical protein
MIPRLKRLWQLSGPQPLPAMAQDARLHYQQLQALDHKADKIMEWMGVLLRAELNRHELQQEEVAPARRALR